MAVAFLIQIADLLQVSRNRVFSGEGYLRGLWEDESLKIGGFFFPLLPEFQSFAKIMFFWRAVQKPEGALEG